MLQLWHVLGGGGRRKEAPRWGTSTWDPRIFGIVLPKVTQVRCKQNQVLVFVVVTRVGCLACSSLGGRLQNPHTSINMALAQAMLLILRGLFPPRVPSL